MSMPITSTLSLSVLLALAALPASASPIRQSAPERSAAASSASLVMTFRPRTDAGGKVIGVEVEQRIMRGGSPRPLSLIAPIRFAGMVPVADAVTDLTITDRQGAVAV